MPKLVKNVSLQSIYANVPSGSLKIPAREVVEVEEEDLQSPDMIFHQSRGHIIVVLDVPEVAQPQPTAPPPESGSPPTGTAEPVSAEVRPGRRGGR